MQKQAHSSQLAHLSQASQSNCNYIIDSKLVNMKVLSKLCMITSSFVLSCYRRWRKRSANIVVDEKKSKQYETTGTDITDEDESISSLKRHHRIVVTETISTTTTGLSSAKTGARVTSMVASDDAGRYEDQDPIFDSSKLLYR
jgi:hypothetical protein